MKVITSYKKVDLFETTLQDSDKLIYSQVIRDRGMDDEYENEERQE